MFRILNAQIESQYVDWLSVWRSSGRDPFWHPGYVQLIAGDGGQPLAAVYGSADCGVLFPICVRRIAQEPWASETSCRDFTTPYGYGGPRVFGSPPDSHIEDFWASFDDFMSQRSIVSGFSRLSLFDEILAVPGKTEVLRVNVVRELDSTVDEIWMDYAHKVRKNVKRARRDGVQVVRSSLGETTQLEDFMGVYHATLARREASGSYYYPRTFFEQLHSSMGELLVLFCAYQRGQCVSAELVLAGPDVVYSFLGGTAAESFPSRPNDLIKHEISIWARESGRTSFVLGGGYASGDGIELYKRSFAPNGCVPFRCTARVFDDEQYQLLVERRRKFELSYGTGWSPKPDYFPEYRG